MDLVPPIRAGNFPDKRSARKPGENESNPFARSSASARSFGRARGGEMSLRPTAPLANIPMLLEILSEAGTAANMSSQGKSLHRRKEDADDKRPGGAQYRFVFMNRK